jgi:hypothetical protein
MKIQIVWLWLCFVWDKAYGQVILVYVLLIFDIFCSSRSKYDFVDRYFFRKYKFKLCFSSLIFFLFSNSEVDEGTGTEC